MKVSEDVAFHFESFLLRLEIIRVDRETQEEKSIDHVDLDLS